MKKVIVAILVIGVFVASPLVIGMISANQLEAEIAQMNELPGYRAELVEYDRGYLTSAAVIRLALDAAQWDDSIQADAEWVGTAEEGVLFDAAIAHGPLLIGSGISVGLTHTQIRFVEEQSFVQEAQRELQVDDMLLIEYRIGLFGGGSAQATVTPISVDEEGQHFSFGGMELFADLSGYGKHYDMSGTIGPLNIDADGQRAQVSAIQLQAQGSVPGDNLWGEGEFEMTLPALSFTAPHGESGEMQGMVFGAAVAKASEGLYDVDYRIAIENVEGSSFERSVQNINVDLVLANMKQSAIQALAELNYDASAQGNEQQMISLLDEVLAESPALIINDISYEMDGVKQVSLDGEVRFNSEEFDQPLTLQSMPLMLGAVDLTLNAMANQALILESIAAYSAQQAQTMAVTMEIPAEDLPALQQQIGANLQQNLDMMVQEGMITLDGNRYKTQAKMRKGELTVNDYPIPL